MNPSSRVIIRWEKRGENRNMPMNVAYEIDKLMVENNMKDEEKIEIVANNYSNS